MPIHVSSTCAHHQEVKIALQVERGLSQPVHEAATYKCDDTRGCIMQFLPPDDEHMCSKHVEAWNKLIVKQKFCASSWLITETNLPDLFSISPPIRRGLQGIFFLWEGSGNLLSTRVKCDRLCDLFSTKSAPYPILAVPTFQKQQMAALYLNSFCFSLKILACVCNTCLLWSPN